MPLERLEAEITELAGHLAAAECRWLRLIAEFDRREGHAHWGCQTCAHWLSWHCGLAPRAARERVRVARALEELPLITAEFATGKLSYSKVRAITRVATPDNEATLVELALHSTAVHVERSVRALRSVLGREGETDAANARHAARFLQYEWHDDGSLRGSFRIPPEMASVFVKAIDVARGHVPADPDGPAGPACEPAATNSDALMLLAEAFLSHAAPERGGDRFQVVVNVDADVLADDADGVCELDDGPALAPGDGPPDLLRRVHRRSSLRRGRPGVEEGTRHPGCDPPGGTATRPRLPLPGVRPTRLHPGPPHPASSAGREQRAHEPGRAVLVPPSAGARRRLEPPLRPRRRSSRDPAQRQCAPPTPPTVAVRSRVRSSAATSGSASSSDRRRSSRAGTATR